MALWGSIRKQKMRELNNRCEECQTRHDPSFLVLHHVIPRLSGGKDTYNNARLRCQKCEVLYHKLYPDGNKPKGVHREMVRSRPPRSAGLPRLL